MPRKSLELVRQTQPARWKLALLTVPSALISRHTLFLSFLSCLPGPAPPAPPPLTDLESLCSVTSLHRLEGPWDWRYKQLALQQEERKVESSYLHPRGVRQRGLEQWEGTGSGTELGEGLGDSSIVVRQLRFQVTGIYPSVRWGSSCR